MSFAEVEENAASSTTNSEEFEDAQDELRPLPERSTLIIGTGHGSNHPLRRDVLPTESEINNTVISKQLSPRSQSENTSTSSISSSLKVKELLSLMSSMLKELPSFINKKPMIKFFVLMCK